jgi:uncharacterized membrane protein YkvA (DUF1232 family)
VERSVAPPGLMRRLCSVAVASQMPWVQLLVRVLQVATRGRRPNAPGGSAGGLDLAGGRFRPGAEEKIGMSGWLRAVLLAVGLMVGTWALLVLLARRLPPGLLRDLAGFVPDCVTTIRRLRRDPRVPRRAKVVVALAGLWLLSPIDLLPEFLPVIGPLDDVLVVALALRYAARQVPREVLVAAWPGEPRLLERLLGGPAPATG